MRDSLQEVDEGSFLDDAMGNPRMAAEEMWSGQIVQTEAAGQKACLKEYGETERLSKVLEYFKRKLIPCEATQDELDMAHGKLSI